MATIKNDRAVVNNRLRPRFEKLAMEQITLPLVTAWIDELAASDCRRRPSATP